MGDANVAAFVARLHDRVTRAHGGVSAQGDPLTGSDLEWVAGGESPGGDAVVLYRERSGGPVLGERYDLVEFAALFGPGTTIEALADIVFTDSLADPTGRGIVLDVDWADGIYPGDERIQWVELPPARQ